MKTTQQLLCNSSPTLQRLYKYSDALQKLTQLLPQLLPTPLHLHCQVANLRQDVLILHVDNAIWAMHLRFQEQEICQRWQQLMPHLPPLQRVEVKVRLLPMTVKREKLSPPQPLSTTTIELLQQVAENTPHARLKTALLKLARHGQAAHKNRSE